MLLDYTENNSKGNKNTLEEKEIILGPSILKTRQFFLFFFFL